MEPSRFKALIRFNKRRTQTLYERVQRQLFFRNIIFTIEQTKQKPLRGFFLTSKQASGKKKPQIIRKVDNANRY